MAKLYVICGHGDGDPGALGNNYEEATQVRKLGKRIKELGGSNVILGNPSRNFYRDNGISKLTISKEYKLCELHMDSNPKEEPHGGHVIINEGFDPDEYDNKLADLLNEHFPGRSDLIVDRGNLANPDRAARRGYNYRLLECGFISNKRDADYFEEHIDELARGILGCFGIPVVDGANPVPTPEPEQVPTPAPTPSNNYYPVFNSTSIVDGLASIGVGNSMSNRKKIAIANGISGYCGTASQNEKLLSLARQGRLKKAGSYTPSARPSASYYPKFNSGSIVDGLKSIGVDSSMNNRRKIASANGVGGYRGTASQNETLLSLARQGKLKKA